MFFLSILAFSFFISPALSMRILGWDMDFPGLTVQNLDDSDTQLCKPSDGTPLDARSAVLRIRSGIVNPDNAHKRRAVCVNDQFPAPLIKAWKGDNFNIDVSNELTPLAGDPGEIMSLDMNTSVHFHGISQHGTNWADGTSYVTQCPLRVGETFAHRFNADGQTGTYWYHSHYRDQYCDGLRGPLVIYDPEDPRERKRCNAEEMENDPDNKCCHANDPVDPLEFDCYVDDEKTVITLADWYHEVSTEIDAFPNPGPKHSERSTIINGKGRYMNNGAELSFIDVVEESRYRLRLVSMACNDWFDFAIDGHTMTIIEVEGIEVEPEEVDKLPIFPAQRYSVVITTKKLEPGDPDRYWIRALRNGDRTKTGLAILRYKETLGDPTTSPDAYKLPFDEGKLHPLVNPGAPGIPKIGEADVNLVLAVGNTSDSFTMNGTPFESPSMPVLLQILSGRRKPWELMPLSNIYTLPPNKVIEISFPRPDSATDGAHPMHLHGHNFDVVRVSGSQETNFVNPVRRDTVSIGKEPTDNVVIRFVTDNPGPWFLHCHIDWHLVHGFAVVMAEAPDETYDEQRSQFPENGTRVCSPGENWGQKTTLGLPGY